MEKPGKLDGLQVCPAEVPKFQAYLRQQLGFEHRRRRLQRSQRAWMVVAMVSLGFVGLGLAQPRPFIRAHYALFPARALGSGPEHELVGGELASRESMSVENPLVQTVAASLERDRAVAARLGARGLDLGTVAPERAFVVSRFPLPDGREIHVYTSLLPEGDEIVTNAVAVPEGGAW
jgi:hypothetical protein